MGDWLYAMLVKVGKRRCGDWRGVLRVLRVGMLSLVF